MNNQSKPSETAVVTASLRALACYENDEKVRYKDQLAELFLPEEKKEQLKDEGFINIIKKAIPAGLYEYIIARTSYFDELFTHHLKEGIPQIVLLGAGYDSRPYRFDYLIGNTIIFEVDTIGTQEQKRLILHSKGIHCNRNIRYVTLDFEQGDLINALSDKGFNPLLQSLFIWEGVTFYLNPTTVKKVLKLLSSNSVKNSILSFDFQDIYNGQDLIDTSLEEEVICFGIETGTIREYLEELGYVVIENLNSEEMGKRYLTCRDGSRFGSIKPIMNIVTTKVI